MDKINQYICLAYKEDSSAFRDHFWEILTTEAEECVGIRKTRTRQYFFSLTRRSKKHKKRFKKLLNRQYFDEKKTVKFHIYVDVRASHTLSTILKNRPRIPHLDDLKSNQIGTITLRCRASYIVREKYLDDAWRFNGPPFTKTGFFISLYFSS